MNAHWKRRAAAVACQMLLAVLPAALKSWGHAIRCETDAIEDDTAALLFALQSVLGMIPRAITWHLFRPFARFVGEGAPLSGAPLLARVVEGVIWHPQLVGVLSAVVGVALGLVYLAMAGAPARSLAVNTGALILGLIVLAALGRIGARRQMFTGWTIAAMATALLATGLFGTSVEGASRWVRLGGFALQPSLILVPVMLVAFAQCRNRLSAAGMVIAAAAMAIQPDRAMSGMMVAGLLALAVNRADRFVMTALGASFASFAVTLLRPDTLSPAAFVDQVIASSFGVHVLAGVAVLVGLGILLVPAALGLRTDPASRGTYCVFCAVWFAAILAAWIGNYPTPIVGYGASAIVGYLLSLLALPGRVKAQVRQQTFPTGAEDLGPTGRSLLAGHA